MSPPDHFYAYPLPDSQLIPVYLYGTAWKEERTADLVYQAIKWGFRGFDTAAQPGSYREDLVGAAIRRAIGSGALQRSDFFVSGSCRYTATPFRHLL